MEMQELKLPKPGEKTEEFEVLDEGQLLILLKKMWISTSRWWMTRRQRIGGANRASRPKM